MLKYANYDIVAGEVPDEISLAINISNCPIHCRGCHSQYLWENNGRYLSIPNLDKLIKENKGITCVALMGGDSEVNYIVTIAKYIKLNYPLKVCWYSGRDSLFRKVDENLCYFDYIKLGHYDQDKGGLESKTTNQRFYRVRNNRLFDETFKFWNKQKDVL